MSGTRLFYILRRALRTLVGKVAWYAFLTIGALFILRISVIDDAFSQGALAILGIVVGLIGAFFVLVVISFMVYHGIKHGNPMIDYALDPVEVTYTTHTTKVVKKDAWCPICKANSGCRVSRNPVTRTLVHILR